VRHNPSTGSTLNYAMLYCNDWQQHIARAVWLLLSPTGFRQVNYPQKWPRKRLWMSSHH